MKKIVTDHFDKILMFVAFVMIFFASIFYPMEWLGTLTRDAFLVLATLLGFRRAPTPVVSTIDAESKQEEPTEFIG